MRKQLVGGLRKLLYKCYKILRGPVIETGDALSTRTREMAQSPIPLLPQAALSMEEWMRHSREISAGLEDLLADPIQGPTIRTLLNEQVSLITSLPIEAGQRVQALTLEAMTGRGSAADIIEEIMRSGQVTLNRATLIARTETARANAVMTQARAESIGSPGYVWRTAHDDRVRDVHRRLDGKVFNWDDPPVAMKDGTKAHPGETPNCRCWADPVIPGMEEERPRRSRLRAA